MSKSGGVNGTSVLVEMAMSYFRSRVHCSAARLGIADYLGDGEKTVRELAAACGADHSSLYRPLRALATFGVVSETGLERFALAPLGAPLRKSTPDSVCAAVVFWADLLADSWSHLTECVRTGDTAALYAPIARAWNFADRV
ncbi:MAG: O-demethylpuromycin O-methyltransferase [Bryobacterales bacterium]|nr:O-demethylpuromycin O-methyltransferase [Bryobacterales bacterium]